jgi:alkanesulfonate monooxygenase SsuD/methylene tetrahydromethanopterin reductase-like flavin-dependent oxidoreductase (luciferase family)
MRHGLSVPNFAEPRHLMELAELADRNGWDGFFLWDHIVVDLQRPPPISDSWTVLAAVAGATRRVRLGTLVTPVARRRPWVLARQVTTLDHLSGGRAVLGVGLGVPPHAEYGALGEDADPKEHGRLLDEGLDVIAALWRGDPVKHHGPRHHLDGVRFRPTPVQEPRVPIWCAAVLPAHAGVRRSARWDGVVPLHAEGEGHRLVTPEEVAGIVAEVEARREQAGADGPGPGFDVVVLAAAPDAGQRAAFEEAGTTWLIEGPAPGEDWLEDARAIASARPPLG